MSEIASQLKNERKAACMTVIDPKDAAFGFLVMYAYKMYPSELVRGNCLNPSDGIKALGWTIVGHLTAQDEVRSPVMLISAPDPVFFGFLARNTADPTSYVAVICGTERMIEWLIDADPFPVAHPTCQKAEVENGFWSIYNNMNLDVTNPATGQTTRRNVIDGVAEVVGTGSIVVAGHSLGAALATYLTFDLAEKLGQARVSACLFGSPRTGNSAWASLFGNRVNNNYRLYNYLLDYVTHAPLATEYATLPNATVILPSTAQTGICADPVCRHSVISYCAMISYKDTMALASCDPRWKCIAPTVPDEDRRLEMMIKAGRVADQDVRCALREIYNFAAQKADPVSGKVVLDDTGGGATDAV